MQGQTSKWIYASSEDVYSYAWTYQVKPARSVFAEAALVRLNDISAGDGVFGRVGVSQIVSDKGVENFPDHPQGSIYRNGTTSVTFEILVLNSYAEGRWFFNYWS